MAATKRKKRNKITASQLPLLSKCAGPSFLECTDSVNDPQRRGIFFHQFISDYIIHGREIALELCDKEIIDMAENSDFSNWFDGQFEYLQSEVSFAWDPKKDVAVELGSLLERDYSKAPRGWICGTADIINVGDDAIFLDDIKTGRSFVPGPYDNYQLKFLALAASRAYNIPKVYARILFVDEDGLIKAHDHSVFDSFQLDQIHKDLKGILAKKELVLGDHCKWCPAFNDCPAIAKGALAILKEENGEALQINDDTLQRVWPKVAALEAYSRKFKEAAKVYVRRNGAIDLGDGKHLELSTFTKSSIESEKALPILKNHLGQMFPQSLSISRASIKRAVSDYCESRLVDNPDKPLKP